MKIISATVLCGILALLQVCRGTNDIILSDVQIENNDDAIVENDFRNTEPFIPTTEWQVVKPNQAIPAGLHIRMNFQTGIKEAKILEHENDESSSSNKQTKNDESSSSNKQTKGPKIILSEESKHINEFPQSNDKIYFTKSHLKEALHEFRDKVGTKDVDDITWSSDAKKMMEEQIAHEARVKKKFRSIEEIKAELEETMKMKIKSDVEIMKELTYYITANNSSLSEKGAALDNLEYYVHQIDNGIDLNKIGGLEPVVLLLNSTNEDIQERAANVIGAATQNNKEVQIAVLHYGGLRLLLQMLHQEKKALTKKKALYALSAVIRDNSNAQNELVKLNGIQSIIQIIKDQSLVTSLHVKAIDLLFDLIEEQNEIMKKLKESGQADIHGRSQLLNLMVKSGLCSMLVPLLETQDFYTKEKVMHAIRVSVDGCKDTLKQPDEIKHLEKELSQLKHNIKDEDDADFKSYLETLRVQLEKNVLEKLRS